MFYLTLIDNILKLNKYSLCVSLFEMSSSAILVADLNISNFWTETISVFESLSLTIQDLAQPCLHNHNKNIYVRKPEPMFDSPYSPRPCFATNTGDVHTLCQTDSAEKMLLLPALS